MREFWRRAADPRGATLVTGDVTLAEVRAMAQRLRKLEGAGQSVPRPADPDSCPTRRRTSCWWTSPVPRRAWSIIGAPGVTAHSPDYPAIMLMNTILGGSFSSRLNDVLREQKG